MEKTDSKWLIWHRSPAEPAESRDVIHVWGCDLDDPALGRFCDEFSLSTEEEQQMERLRSARKQWIFRRRRALGRFLLGRFLGTEPKGLQFAESELGEPILIHPDSNRCHFNTSHSEGIFTMAISARWEIGVDVEVARDGWDWQSVAEMYLDAGRLLQLNRVAEGQRQESFLRFWALHEAFAKASGAGIVCETEDGVSPEQVWDLVFEPDRMDGTVAASGWQWSQRGMRIGESDAEVAVVARKSIGASHAPAIVKP